MGALGGLLEYLTAPKHFQEVQDIDEFRVAGTANLFIKPYDFVERTPDFSVKFGHNGFLRGRLSTDRADLRGFPIADFLPGNPTGGDVGANEEPPLRIGSNHCEKQGLSARTSASTEE